MNLDLMRRLVTGASVAEDDDEQLDRIPATQQRPPPDPRRQIKTRSVKVRDMSWHDHMSMLLQIGAAIEHGLMVQYLYAAYSMDAAQVPEPHRKKVERWRGSLIAVAMEEMGHMLTLQNILAFIGAPISLNRGDFPWDARYYPFPFSLEPLTDQSLACYVYAEMPDRPHIETRKNEPRYWLFLMRDERAITQAIQQRDPTPHQVGMLYRETIALMKDSKRIPESAFRPDTFAVQAGPDDWARGRQRGGHYTPPPSTGPKNPSSHGAHVIISRVRTRQEAVDALTEISAQGEGPEAGSRDDPSHFDRFLEVYQDYRKARGNDTWRISRKVPENPSTLLHEEAGNKGDFISAHRARYWGYLFNLRYRMLLSYLGHSFRLARDAAAKSMRAQVMEHVFAEMQQIRAISHILVRQPFHGPRDLIKHTDPEYAGPPFEMPYSIRLPYDDIDCWRMHLGMLDTSRKLSRVLFKGSDCDGQLYLAALRDFDDRSRLWIASVSGLPT